LSKVVIIGFGNILFKDEGVGCWVAQELQKRHLPPGVEVIDGGTASLDLLLDGKKIRKIIIIDALKGEGKPGTLYKVPIDELIQRESLPFSLHQFDLLRTLWLMKHENPCCKEVVLIGVEPDEIQWGLGLSESIQERLSEIIALILKEVEYAYNGV